jgi:hypothetical protein
MKRTLVQIVAALALVDGFAVQQASHHSSSSTTTTSLNAYTGKVLVCTGPTCGRKGGKKVLKIFEELAPEGIEIEAFSCVSDCAGKQCFDEMRTFGKATTLPISTYTNLSLHSSQNVTWDQMQKFEKLGMRVPFIPSKTASRPKSK